MDAQDVVRIAYRDTHTLWGKMSTTPSTDDGFLLGTPTDKMKVLLMGVWKNAEHQPL